MCLKINNVVLLKILSFYHYYKHPKKKFLEKVKFNFYLFNGKIHKQTSEENIIEIPYFVIKEDLIDIGSTHIA